MNYMDITAAPPGAQSDLNDAVRNRHSGRLVYCGICNAFVPRTTRTVHNDYHNSYTYRKDGNMSNVTWCDPGNHSFKANEPGSTHYSAQEIDENGNPVIGEVDACKLHNPFRPKPETNGDAIMRELKSHTVADDE